MQTLPETEAMDVAMLADRLRPVMLKLSRHLRREAQRLGISVLDAQLLGIVHKRPAIGISELAEIEQMSRPSMSVHIKRLEAAGWLKRMEDAGGADRRRAPLMLTPDGEATLNAIRRSRNDWLEARLSGLDADERRALSAAVEPLVRLVEMRP